MPKNENELDGFVYTLETIRVLKDEIGQTFQVYEENADELPSIGSRAKRTFCSWIRTATEVGRFMAAETLRR
jgi:hypothetical protein